MPTAPTNGGTISGSGTSAASRRRPGKLVAVQQQRGADADDAAIDAC